MPRFTIQKSTRADPYRTDSYMGPAWDAAGLRDRYKETYDDPEEAQELAAALTVENPVGFVVVQVVVLC